MTKADMLLRAVGSRGLTGVTQHPANTDTPMICGSTMRLNFIVLQAVCNTTITY